MPKFTSHDWLFIVGIIFSSCHAGRDITGTYRTSYPVFGMLTTKIKLNPDSTFERVIRSKISYDSAIGEYRVLDHKVFFTLIWEKTGPYRYSRVERQPKIYRSGHDSISYQALYFLGNNKLFFRNFETGKKETLYSSKKRSYMERVYE